MKTFQSVKLWKLPNWARAFGPFAKAAHYNYSWENQVNQQTEKPENKLEFQRELLKHWPFPLKVLDSKPQSVPDTILEGMEEAFL
jgi:hypothetical protein